MNGRPEKKDRRKRGDARPARRSFLVEALEPRILLSADPLAALLGAALDHDLGDDPLDELGETAVEAARLDTLAMGSTAAEESAPTESHNSAAVDETADGDWLVDADLLVVDTAATTGDAEADRTVQTVAVATISIPASDAASVPSSDVDPGHPAEVPDDLLARGPPTPDATEQAPFATQRDTTITAAAESAIRAGLQSLSDWLDDLDALSVFQQALPLINRSVQANSDLPDTLVQLVADVNAYFDGLGGSDPTVEGLIAALLANVDTGPVTGGLVADEFQFNLVFQRAFSPAPANLDLSGSLSSIDLELAATAALSASGDVDLDLQFGYDTTNGTFFLRFNGFSVDAGAMASNIALTARLGFIDVAGASGTASLAGSIAVSLVDPDNADGRGYISLSELTGTPVGTLVSADLSGTASLDLSITSSLIPGPVLLELDWADVAQAALETTNLASLGAYVGLEALTAADLRDGLLDLIGWSGSFDSPFSLATTLPVIGRNLAAALDLPGLFGELLDSGLGIFDSVDTFVNELLAVAGLDNAQASLVGDQLYFDFDVDATRNRTVEFSWDESSLVDLRLDVPTLSLGVAVAGALRVGIDLGQLEFFVVTDQLQPELQVTATVDLPSFNASGGIGFLQVDVTGGSAALDLGVTLDLVDPGGQGRLTAGLLGNFTGSITDYLDLDFSGSAGLALPLSSPLLPGAGTQTLTADWPDVTDPGSFTTNADQIGAFLGFENVTAFDFSQGIDLLADVLGDLAAEQVGQAELLNRKLPLLNQSIAEIIDLEAFVDSAIAFVTTLIVDGQTGEVEVPFRDSAELLALLQSLPGVSQVLAFASGQDISYRLQLQKQSSTAFPVDLALDSFVNLDLTASVMLTLTTTVDVTFGISGDSGLFFIGENMPGTPNVSVDLLVDAAALTAAMRLASLDVTVTGGTADLTGSVAVRLVDPMTDDGVGVDPRIGFDPPASPGKISFAELQNAGLFSLAEVVISGSAAASLPVHAELLGFDYDDTLDVSWSDIKQIEAPALSLPAITYDTDADDVATFFEELLDAGDNSGEGDGLGSDLAAVGGSVGGLWSKALDLIRTGWSDLVDTIKEKALDYTWDFLKDQLESLLGTTVTVTPDDNELRFTLVYDTSFSETIDFNFDDALSGLGFQASGEQTATGSATLSLEIGADFSGGLAALDRLYIVEGANSYAQIAFQVLTPTPISATATFGLISLGVDMGTITVAGRTAGVLDPAKSATGTVSFVDPGAGMAADGRITLGEILAGPLGIFGSPVFDGAAEIDLPLTSSLIPPTEMPYVNVSWTDISDFGTLALDVDVSALIAVATNFDFTTALSGIDSIVDLIADWATDEILNYELPYVDLTVGELFDYIATADSFFQAIILANPMTGVLFDQAVQGAIAAAGLDPAHVTLTPSSDPMLHDPMASTPRFYYTLVFDYDVMTSVPFGFDLGGGILTLDAMLQPTVAFDFALDFGLNEDDGFFIVDQGTSAGAELTLAAGLFLPIDLFGGQFGPLTYGVSNGSAMLTADFDLDLVDPDSPTAGGRVGAGQLFANPLQVLDASLSGSGELRLPMGLRLGGGGPAVLTSFTAFWDSAEPGRLTYGTVDGTPTGAPLGSRDVRDGFGPVLFELGEIMQEVIGPLLTEIAQYNPVTEDIQDALTTKLPIVNKSALELLGDVLGDETVELLFEILAEISRFNGLITGNAIDLTAYFSGESAPANPGPGIADVDDAPANEQTSFFPFLDDLENQYHVSLPFLENVGSAVISTLLGQEVDLIVWDPPGFEFAKSWSESLPIAVIPIVPLITVDFALELGGTVGFRGDFELGLTSRGLLQSGDLLDGFYFGDNISGGVDPFELSVFAEIYARAKGTGKIAGIVEFAEVGISAGVGGEIGIDLSDWDPDPLALDPLITRDEPGRGDNRIYGDEITAILTASPPLGIGCLLHPGGELYSFAGFDIWVGFDTPFGKITLYSDGASVRWTLFNWDIPCDNWVEADLAEVNGNRLEMLPAPGGLPDQFIGASIIEDADGVPNKLRIVRHDVDSPSVRYYEEFLLADLSAVDTVALLGTDANDQISIEPNVGEHFEHVEVDALAGDDFVEFGRDYDGGSSILQDFTVWGRAGADILMGADAPNVIMGGPGDDRINGGPFDDVLWGEAGNDVIGGGDGDDTIDGGDDDDQLRGNGGVDLLIAGAGVDYLNGGAGDDEEYGDAGNDTVVGDRDADTLHGGDDDDLLLGSPGDDLLYGDDGSDRLEGEQDRDRLYGGTGDDELFGGAAQDTLFGEAGMDTLHGGAAADGLHGGDDDDLLYGDAGGDSLHGDAGDDTLYGGTGDDRGFGGSGADELHGDAGDDLLYGGAGDDLLYGDAGADQLFGEAGMDTLYGGADDDLLDAGTGAVNFLYGEAGDDRLFGADEGGIDPDFTDMIFFGDVLDGGAGRDFLAGLGGSDLLRGGPGDDELDGGAGNDLLEGGADRDTLHGGAGDDELHGHDVALLDDDAANDVLYGDAGLDLLYGDAGDDLLDGGVDADVLYGMAGRDELLGGGGVGDELHGGADDDVLRGSDDGADLLYGEGGRDRLYGYGGNDSLFGGDGDDTLFGGDGDDLLQGEGGSDVLLGEADHDTLYGHSVSGSGDDGAVDYLYGDFGTNTIDAGAGRDRLFGQGGNDILFGEGDDDLIDPGSSTGDVIVFAPSGEVDDAGFVPPPPTPPPPLDPAPPNPLALAGLPDGASYAARWAELAGSASGPGLGRGAGLAIESSVASDGGATWVAWADARNGNYEIYVARHEGGVWETLAGSAEQGGVSDTAGQSRRPALGLDASGNPVVAWTEITASGSEILVARFDPAADGGAGDWVALGGSLGATGISATGTADEARLLLVAGQPAAVWVDATSGTRQVFARRFDGASWVEMQAGSASGPGVSGEATDVDGLRAATDGTQVAVAYAVLDGASQQIRVREYDGATWSELSPAGGLGGSTATSAAPAVAYHAGSLFAVWTQETPLLGTEIHAARHDGIDFVEAGVGSMSGGGVSNTGGVAATPLLATGGGALHLVWADDRAHNGNGEGVSLYARTWDGASFVEPLAGDAAGRGLSGSGGQVGPVGQVALWVDGAGDPFVSWTESAAGAPSIYLRGQTFAAGTVYVADGMPGATVQEILDAHGFVAGDVILVSGALAGGFTLDADDANVTLVGAPGSSIAGAVTVAADAVGVVLQRMSLNGGLSVAGGAGVTLVESSVAGGVTVAGGTAVRLAHDTIAGAPGLALTSPGSGLIVEWNAIGGSDGIELAGTAADALIRGNDIDPSGTGILLAAPGDGTITGNRITAAQTGLAIAATFAGAIESNEIRGAVVGVQYDAAAALAANRIRDNATGIVTTVAGDVDGLGFVAPGGPNEIFSNGTGVSLVAAQIQNQWIHSNTISVAGTGTIGGSDLAYASLIERHAVGVDSAAFSGDVQFTRIAHNTIGIVAGDGQRIFHNLIYDNASDAIVADGAADLRIYQNTIHAGGGDAVRLTNGSTDAELRGNILWSEAGYDVNVSDDSVDAFFSDHNLLHASGGGTLVHWVVDFTDLLDWQVDVNRFDLHSIGSTAVNPQGSLPAFESFARDDYRLAPLAAGLRATSVALDAGDPALDQALPAGAINLLTNPGFESALAGWSTHVGAGTQGASPAPYEGGSYFFPGSVALGFAEQIVDLIAAGYSAAQIDAGAFKVAFGGRLRSSDDDRGRLELRFLDQVGTQIGSAVLLPDDADTSWEPIGQRWQLLGGFAGVPLGTRQIVYRYEAERVQGTPNNAYLDAAFLRLSDAGSRFDLGAYGATGAETPSSEPHIALRFPDLYTDWDRGTPRTIRWDSLGLSGSSSVVIDLLQDGVDGPAHLLNIAGPLPNSGEYVWTPQTDAIDFATFGLRIAVSLVDNPLVSDRSSEPFAVPEGQPSGVDGFWVDDHSNTDDEYDATAIGDNRNTGKAIDAPKPSITSLLRIYELGAGDTLSVDTGDYGLFHAVSISGTTDLGLGLDEGFTLRGPVVDTTRQVGIRYIVPGPQPQALVELDDADLVTLRNVTLFDGIQGLRVHNGSESFTASDLTAHDNTSDGIWIATSTPGGGLTGLLSYANGADGIHIDGNVGQLTGVEAHDNASDGLWVNNAGAATGIDTALTYDNGIYGVYFNGAGSVLQGIESYGNVHGIHVLGSVASLSNSIAHDNASYGVNFTGSAALLTALTAYHNAYGISVSGAGTVVTDSVAYDHLTNSGYGFQLNGGSTVQNSVSYGNRYGFVVNGGGTVDASVSHHNDYGILLSTSGANAATGSRIYANTLFGILARGNGAQVTGNVVYSNPTGVSVDASGINYTATIAGNLIYANPTLGLLIDDGANQTVSGNTIVQLTGDALVVQNDADGVALRNNVLQVGDGRAVAVDGTSQVGFASDYNLFHVTGAGAVGSWQGLDRTTLTDWRNAAFTDANSLEVDPSFVDPAGADGTIGYLDPVDDGRDDDFHLQSSEGSFHGGSLAPVVSAGTGLPVDLAPTLTPDALLSAGIDRGDAASDFSNETAPAGGYVNLGAYGNTAQASRSPAQYILVIRPNGGERAPQESTFHITWRSDGIVGNVDIAYANGGAFQTLAASEANDGSYDWFVDSLLFPLSTLYEIRVRSVDQPSIEDVSDAPFEVSPPVTEFYVNDGALTGDEYTVAVGNDANDGISPSTPKASIRALLEAYDLKPGDVIFVDTGSYALTANIVIGAEDSGVEIRGPVGGVALLDRGNAAAGSYVFELVDADDVTLNRLEITGAYNGVYAANGQDSDNLSILSSVIHGNANRGVWLGTTSDGLQLLASTIHSNGTGLFLGGDGNQITLSTVHSNATIGVQLDGGGNQITSSASYGNGGNGIYLTGTGNVLDDVTSHDNGQYGIYVTTGSEVRNSESYANLTYGIWASGAGTLVHDSTSRDQQGQTGIYVTGGAQATGNTVYGNRYGLYVSNGRVEGNVAFGNEHGIYLGGGGTSNQAYGNRVYANSVSGITSTRPNDAIVGNEVYSNPVGIVVDPGPSGTATVSGNVIYGNASQGLRVDNGQNHVIRGNTIEQSAGDAVVLQDDADGTTLTDNILGVDGGFAIRIDGTSLTGFASDYNLFHLVGGGQVGEWDGFAFADRVDWFYELGVDQHSRTGDPAFVDVDGADDVAGYGTAELSAALVLDNDDAGFSTIGGWDVVSTGGVNGSVLRALTDATERTAIWSFTGLTAGTYRLAATWITAANYATDAEYTIETTGVNRSWQVNQRNAPADFNDGGVDWELLDDVVVTDGTLTVRLLNTGNSSYVVADALRLVEIAGDRGVDDDLHLQSGSAAIDAGDPLSAYLSEPGPNGARVNQGAYGNTAEAAPSGSSELVQVLTPNGLEKLELGQSVTIEYRVVGLTPEQSVVALNAGGSQVSEPGNGNWLANVYQTQSYVSSSFANAVTFGGVVDPAPEPVYQQYAYAATGVGNRIRWILPVEDGTYTLRLHFAEPSYTTVGARVFDIELQGATALAGYDAIAATGARYAADVQAFTVTASGGTGVQVDLVNVTAPGAFLSGLELLATNPGGVADPTVDLQLSTDDGGSWTPIAAGQGVDRFGLGSFGWSAGPEVAGNLARIRAIANDGTNPQDDSDDVFLIANDGTAYYVNDGSLAGDEYATAIGDNANSGKSPDAPVAGLATILRAYDLDPGDVIYTDSGSYLLPTNLAIDSTDSGVEIRGPQSGVALLDRGNAVSGSHVFELDDADDVTLSHLEITGGYIGIYAPAGSDSDGLVVDSSVIHDHAYRGIWMTPGSDAARIVSSTIHTNGNVGVQLEGDGNQIVSSTIHSSGNHGAYLTGSGNLLDGVTSHNNNGYGIYVTTGSEVRGSESYGNTSYGIFGSGAGTLIRDSVARDQAATFGIYLANGAVGTGNVSFDNAYGFYLSTARAEGNEAYGNDYGFYLGAGTGNELYGNRAYANAITGISSLRPNDEIVGNVVYSNPIGVLVDPASVNSTALVANNLVYDNTNQGLKIDNGQDQRVIGNTIYQSVGEAVVIQNGANNVALFNNILWVDQGTIASVDASSAAGFVADHNLFYRGAASAADVGSWQGAAAADLAAWQAASGGDAASASGDPLFLDIDGADNVFGEAGVPEGDGADDNFALRAGSPAIDAADAFRALVLDGGYPDITGAGRSDDPGTPNGGVGYDLYVETDTGSSSFAATGVGQGWLSPNNSWSYALPFPFDFYGTTYASVWVSSNGFLDFASADTGNANSLADLQAHVRIAPLWDNLQTNVTGGDVFIDESLPDRTTIRWKGRSEDSLDDVNFSVTLFDDGSFRFDYGAGNTGLTPTAGISSGNGATFVLSIHDAQAGLTSANTVDWTPSEGLTYFDIGAYEFQGDSNDVTPPTVTAVLGMPASGGSTDLAFTELQLAFSEPLDGTSARSVANYELLEAGGDLSFDTLDDVVIPLGPAYSFPDTHVLLTLLDGVLPDGDYRLTLSGSLAIYDTAGNPLDGDANGTGGDDFVYLFTIDRSANHAPVADAQAVMVDEDASILITLTGSDVDMDPLAYSISGNPGFGALSGFDPLAHTVTYTPDPDYNGADSFTFEVDDGKAGVAGATVTITVDPLNDAPTAIAQTITVEENVAQLVVLTGVDLETLAGDLVVTITGGPATTGMLTPTATPNVFLYTPGVDYVGPDGFTFHVTDTGDPAGVGVNALTSLDATVDIDVVAVNHSPQLDPVSPQSVAEGSLLELTVTGSDPDAGDTLTFSLDGPPPGATIDPTTGELSWTPADDGLATLVVRLTDDGQPSLAEFVQFDVTVTNVAPTVVISGAPAAFLGQIYTLTLTESDPGDDTIGEWQIDWGDGVEIVSGNPAAVDHVYTSRGSHTITAIAVDEDGNWATNGVPVTVDNAEFAVDLVTPTVSGVIVDFNEAFDPSVLNLHDTELGGLGPADLTLVGDTVGAVSGSLLFDAGLEQVVFVATGGPLAPDTYTLTLHSGATAFFSALGQALDGDDDGAPGVDFTAWFVVAPFAGVTLELDDVARGPGQPVDLPASATGLELRLDDGSGANQVDLTLSYDPTLLAVTNVSLAAGLPGDAILVADFATPGLVTASVSSVSGLAAGPLALLVVTADVPVDAPYGGKAVLDLSAVAVNGGAIASRGDDAVQVVAYLGDTTGNAGYSSLDGQRIFRVVAALDDGFAAFPNLDPVLVGDVTGDGTLSSLDANRVFQEIVGIDPIELPTIPGLIDPIVFAGLDPTLSLPTGVLLRRGERFSAPLAVDTLPAGLEALQLALAYDPDVFVVESVRAGALLDGFGFFWADTDTPGRIRIDASAISPRPVAERGGELVILELRVREVAPARGTILDLQAALLDDGRYTLVPQPHAGRDGTDGLLRIAPVPRALPLEWHDRIRRAAIDGRADRDDDRPEGTS